MTSASSNQTLPNNVLIHNVEDILVPFFKALDDNGIEYCVLHSYEQLPYYVGSDLDIAANINNISDFESILSAVAAANNWEILQRLWYDIPHCFYYVLSSLDGTRRSVAIDILIDRYAVGRYGFDTDTLITGRVKYNGFYHADPSVEFCYKLVKRIRKGAFKSEDSLILNALFDKGDRVTIRKLLADHYGGTNVARIIYTFESDGKFQGVLPSRLYYSIIQLIRKRYRSIGMIIRRALWQARRILYRVYYPSGVIVSLPPTHYEILCNDTSCLDSIRPAFRKTVFKSRRSILDILHALSTSTLLIIRHNNETDAILTWDHYLHSRTVNTATIQSESANQQYVILQTISHAILDLLRRRICIRLDIRSTPNIGNI